jgi:hypothetical protein
MRALLAALALCLLPVRPAFALLCEENSIQADFWAHQARPDTYVLVKGRFTELAFKRHEKAKDRVIWTAVFVGHSASSRAFDQPFSGKVTITDNLFSLIGGSSPQPDRLAVNLEKLEGLVFLKKVSGGYAISTELCHPMIDTDPADVRLALNCLAGRRCPKP